MQGAPPHRCDSQAEEGKAELLVKVCPGSAPELSFAPCFGLSVSAEQPHCTLSSTESKPLCAKAQPWEPWGEAQTTQVPHCGGCSFQLKTFQF